MAYFNEEYIIEFFLRKNKDQEKSPKTGYCVMFEKIVSSNEYKVGSSFEIIGFEIFNNIKDSIKFHSRVFYNADFNGNKYEISKNKFKSASKDNIYIFKINASFSKPGNNGASTYNAKIISEEFNGSTIDALNHYGFSSNVLDNSNEEKLRKQEVKKVIDICKSEVKKLKSKYKSDFDISIQFSVDSDELKEFCEDIKQIYIQIGTGGLYPANSTAEGRRSIDDNKADIRNKIFAELIKNINNEIKKDSSIRGKVYDDWDHMDFMIDYSLK